MKIKNIIFSIILLACFGLLSFLLISNNLLPATWRYMALGILLLINLLLILGLFKSKGGLNILLSLVLLFLAIGQGFAASYVNQSLGA